MFTKTRLLTAGIAAAALLGSSLALAPAAQATTHHISSGWKYGYFDQTNVAVNGDRNYEVIVTPSSKKLVAVKGFAGYAATTYTVKLVRAKTHKVAFTDTKVAPLKALFLYRAFATRPTAWVTSLPSDMKTFDTGTYVQMSSWSTASLKAVKVYVAKHAGTTLQADYVAYDKEYKAEVNVYVKLGPYWTTTGEARSYEQQMYDSINGWISVEQYEDGGFPSSFDKYTDDYDMNENYGNAVPLSNFVDGVKYTVSGTPAKWWINMALPNGVEIGYETSYFPIGSASDPSNTIDSPVGSTHSAEANNPYTWLVGNGKK